MALAHGIAAMPTLISAAIGLTPLVTAGVLNLRKGLSEPTLGQEARDTSLRVDAAARGCAISFLTSDSSAAPDCFLSFFFGITTHDGTASRRKAVHFRTVKVFFCLYLL
jgi:hypothetical protein